MIILPLTEALKSDLHSHSNKDSNKEKNYHLVCVCESDLRTAQKWLIYYYL